MSISSDVMNLIKFVITSNSALNVMNNDYFFKVSKVCPSYREFRHNLLPAVFKKLNMQIQMILDSAMYVVLLTDLWTDPYQRDFIALVAIVINVDSSSKVMTMAMKRCTEGHTGEYLRTVIEDMVNSFDFDKTKIKCK